MKNINILNFIKEVKHEGKKIVWPTRKETVITTVMVLIMVIIFSVFFLLVDNIIAWLIKTLMGI
ncbi:MAG: preprotein translocase subunit SecE [Pseudomonadota bacterium]|nr:preprotein translocase subunit SecE [Pseudomonadota bacterium]